jgi:hypothetical protein
MKLWLVSQGINNGYDTFDSMVVVAEQESDARKIHPAETWDWIDEENYNYWQYNSVWANTPEQVDIEYIGEAAPNTDAGIVLASFNAG